MKVLLINKYHTIKGGTETYYFGLQELLKKRGHHVICFAMEDEKNIPCEQSDYFVKNVEFNGDVSLINKVTSGFKMLYSFEAKKKLTQLLKDEKPDVIHINLFHRHLTISILDAIKKSGIPCVFTMHDLNCICPNHIMLDNEGKICDLCINNKFISCAKKKCVKCSAMKSYLAAFEAYTYKKSDAYNKIDLFITPSYFYKQLLIKAGITKAPIKHFKNFLPSSTEYKVYDAESYILFYGRLSVEKGVITLLKAMKNIDYQLYIVGTGPQEDEIKAFAKDKNLLDKVCFKGFQTGESLKNFVRHAKCVVVPSEWYEASGYTASEAMACGTPIVVTDIGGLPENIEDGISGFLSKPFDEEDLAEKINKVINLPQNEYRKVCVAAMEKARADFDAENYADKLIKEYNELIVKVQNKG